MIIIVLISFLLMLLLAFPILAALGTVSVLPTFLDPGFAGNISYVLRSIVGGLDSTPIIAIPLFMLSGDIMAKGGISKKLFDIFALLVGKRTAGIPCAVIITCLFYGAISGSGPATTAAVGGMCIPILVGLGYDKVFSTALVATAGGLGVIIPPSIPFVVYGVATGVSVGALFTAGVLPGILIAVALMAYAYLYCRRAGEDKARVAENYHALKERGTFRVLKEGFWALLTPVIILGGIYGGIVTPTEAACISVFYALFVSIVIYRTSRWRDILNFMRGSVANYAAIIGLLAFANAFSRVITLLDAPQLLSEFLNQAFGNKYLFLLVLNLVLLVIGMFMDTGPALAILAPLFLPAAKALGVDAVHFGIIMVVNLAIGLVSPPFGTNLFVAAAITKIPSIQIGKKAIPFLLFFILALIMITYIPAISLLLGGS
ncbi:TRAP transporter large permease [Hominifimenecus sp. rT4P-3]|uniref:TRAP transporter large permease n=1 Tax=Hominifimenecus sp. rT4P-3 TaxID=3242979 RepID=UPI003DA27453